MVGDLAVERYKVTGGGRVTRHWPSDRIGKAKRDVCVWEEDGYGWWKKGCGIAWINMDGTPKENSMNYFLRCGKRLKQKGGKK